MAEVQLRNISKKWGDFVGVADFDLTIADREFLVLLGPSGRRAVARRRPCA